MLNEGRSNVWLAVELLIVSVVMWYVVDSLWVELKVYAEPDGFDVERCYKLTTFYISEASPDFDPNAEEDGGSSSVRLLNMLKNHQDVEKAADLMWEFPYPRSYSSGGMSLYNGRDTLNISNTVYLMQSSPEALIALGYTGANGESSEELAEILRRGESLLSENCNRTDEGNDFDPYSAIGYWSSNFSGDGSQVVVGGIVRTPRINRFTPSKNVGVIIFPSKGTYGNFVVKVKKGHERAFEEDLYENSELKYRSGNLYVSDMQSYDVIGREDERESRLKVRNLVACMVFLAVTIFLGLLGTFWFRTQQRVSEIALRKVNGATSGAIFRRLVTEGLLLLITVTPLAVLIDWLIVDKELTSEYYETYGGFERMAFCVTLTFVLLALMIALGVWWPARKAMRVDASVALKSE